MATRLTFKDWLLATRPWSFPASAIPALLGLSYAFFLYKHSHEPLSMHWTDGLLAVLGSVLFHAAGNLISDYYDHINHVDPEQGDLYGSALSRDVALTPRQILRLGQLFFAIGSAIGLYLTWSCGLPVLYMGLIGAVLTYTYHAFKYRALGDLNILITFGLLVPLGTCYATLHAMYPSTLLISLPLALLVVNILNANNTRDMLTDRSSGIRTIPILVGLSGAKTYYYTLTTLAYIVLVALVASCLLPITTLLALLTIPIAIANCRRIRHATIETLSTIVELDGATAKLVTLIGIIQIAALFTAHLL